MNAQTDTDRPWTMMERFEHAQADRDADHAARERLREHPPIIGKPVQRGQAALPTAHGLRFVKARRYFVGMPLWHVAYLFDFGVTSEGFRAAKNRMECFHWPTGAFIASGRTSAEAIMNAVVKIERNGRAAFEKAVDEQLATTDGKRLN